MSIPLASCVAFPWAPDWSQEPLERLEWYTNVLPAYRGEEQRRSLRLGPRQQLEFAFAADGQRRRVLESVLFKHGGGLFALPIWFDALALTASLTAGSTSIPLNPAQRQFAVGDYVLLIGDNPLVYEMATVASVSGSIGLSAGTASTWPIGTRVVPARPARLLGQPSFNRFSGDVSSTRLRFECAEPAQCTPASDVSYRGHAVLETALDWSDEPTLNLSRVLAEFDSGTGATAITDVAQMAFPEQSGRITFANRAEAYAWRQRLFALRGKHAAIWVPSPAQDLQVVADIGSAATTIDVQWAGYTDYLLGEPNRKDIRIKLRNGSVLYRRITAASEISASVERLTIDSALGVAVVAADVAHVGYLTLMRQSSDAAELSYWTSEIADCAISFQGFRHDL